MIKETVLDVLIYLFDNYMDTDLDLSKEEESFYQELIAAGFSEEKIDKAFLWLEGLSEQQNALPLVATSHSLRIYNDEELERLNVECRGFLLFLEQIKVLEPTIREMIIDRAMALETDEVDLDQLKWVIMMVLFNQPGQESSLAWIEDLVFNEVPGYLH